MTPKDLFQTAARILGLWTMLQMIDYLVMVFDISQHFYRPTSSSLQSGLVHATVYGALTSYLLSGAPHLVRRLYDLPAEKN